jgi:hypothetical protein
LNDLPPEIIPDAGAIGTGTIYADDMRQVNARKIQYIDVDGDIVTVSSPKGQLSLAGNFAFSTTNAIGVASCRRSI